MKKEEAFQDAFINMSSEFYVNHRKICREINTIFNNEIVHFKELLLAFNDEYNCLESSAIDYSVEKIKEIFNTSRVMLVNDYEDKFSRTVEELTSAMYDFFVKKANDKHPRSPAKEINERLKEICKFDCFLIDDKLEDELIDFAGEFGYNSIKISMCIFTINILITKLSSKIY